MRNSGIEDSEQNALNSLYKLLYTLFNDDELHELCFKLKVDYESLPGDSKRTKALNFVKYMKRRNRIDELTLRIHQERPFAGKNEQSLAVEVSPSNDPRLGEINSPIGQLRRYNNRLIEWKELHNRMNTLLNIFDPFGKKIIRLDATGEGIDLGQVQDNWQSVELNILSLLNWAKVIHYIDEPFQEFDDGFVGAEWAIELNVLYRFLHDHLWHPPHSGFIEASRQDVWWRTLLDNTYQLENTIKKFLFSADEELRKAASDLYDFSVEALWSKTE